MERRDIIRPMSRDLPNFRVVTSVWDLFKRIEKMTQVPVLEPNGDLSLDMSGNAIMESAKIFAEWKKRKGLEIDNEKSTSELYTTSDDNDNITTDKIIRKKGFNFEITPFVRSTYIAFEKYVEMCANNSEIQVYKSELAEEAGQSISSLYKSCKILEKLGFIKIIQNVDEKTRQNFANTYEINNPYEVARNLNLELDAEELRLESELNARVDSMFAKINESYQPSIDELVADEDANTENNNTNSKREFNEKIVQKALNIIIDGINTAPQKFTKTYKIEDTFETKQLKENIQYDFMTEFIQTKIDNSANDNEKNKYKKQKQIYDELADTLKFILLNPKSYKIKLGNGDFKNLSYEQVRADILLLNDDKFLKLASSLCSTLHDRPISCPDIYIVTCVYNLNIKPFFRRLSLTNEQLVNEYMDKSRTPQHNFNQLQKILDLW